MDGHPRHHRAALTAIALLTAACGPASPDIPPAPPPAAVAPSATPPVSLPPEAAPLGKLPPDTRPSRYRIELRVDPARPRFEGVVDIAVELDRLRDVIWMHGRDLTVTRATVQPEGFAPMGARWEVHSKGGVASLRPDVPVGPGRVTLHLEYSAPFNDGDQGLSAVEQGGARYVASQLEATDARRVFPSFDEPRFKTPFEIILHVPAGQAAISNGRELAREPESPPGFERVSFALTEKLPTYLVAIAVGPWDVVNGPPVPPNAYRKTPLALRGVASRGRGKELSYALAHTGEIVTALEGYFGLAFPYDKLDLIAVPQKGGAMENAGAVTFSEVILLHDEKNITADQRGAFTAVTMHEIGHQWFGDLVTARWWDDIWLNEAFATWTEGRLVPKVAPDLGLDLYALRSTHKAMDDDSLISARKIRQEIESDDDIDNAFDRITYEKGAGVISMFERWMGEEAFQRGIHAYVASHAHGSGSTDELLAALSTAAGRDVAAPFRTFLDQPGLPFVEVRLACDGKPRLELSQSRFLPVGSSGDDKKTWQLPVCARYADGSSTKRSCALLTEARGTLPLETSTCPAWVMPNADGAGYYRWSLAGEATKGLVKNLSALTAQERMSFADSIKASYLRARLPAAEALAALAPLAADPVSAVAAVPAEVLHSMDEWLDPDPALRAAQRAFGKKLYQPVVRALGWSPKGTSEPADQNLRRRAAIDHLTLSARDPELRRDAAARGRRFVEGKADAVSIDLAPTAVAVAMEEGDAALFDAIVARLAKEQSARERRVFARALGAATKPDLAARARDLTLDPKGPLKPNEVLSVLNAQMERPALRAAAWSWFQAHTAEVLKRMPEVWRSRVIWIGGGFCEAGRAEEVTKTFTPHLGEIGGGPRELSGVVEEIRLCAARKAAHEASARAFFGKQKGR